MFCHFFVCLYMSSVFFMNCCSFSGQIYSVPSSVQLTYIITQHYSWAHCMFAWFFHIPNIVTCPKRNVNLTMTYEHLQYIQCIIRNNNKFRIKEKEVVLKHNLPKHAPLTHVQECGIYTDVNAHTDYESYCKWTCFSCLYPGTTVLCLPYI